MFAQLYFLYIQLKFIEYELIQQTVITTIYLKKKIWINDSIKLYIISTCTLPHIYKLFELKYSISVSSRLDDDS